MKQYCLALDLVNDETLITEYENYHKKIWPQIEESIFGSGILSMQIFRVENRLFMIMNTTNDFSFEAKANADTNNPKVIEWENLMWKYQQALPNSKPGEKWRLMNCIFSIEQNKEQ